MRKKAINTKSATPAAQPGKALRPVGRPRVHTPERIADKFERYVEYLRDNPLTKEIPTRGDVVKVHLKRPATIIGFCVFAGMAEDSFYHYASIDDYKDVIERIRRCIRADQLEGGLTGIYESNIVARLLHLIEHQDVTSNGEKINKGSDITVIVDSDAASIIKSVGPCSVCDKNEA